MMFDLFRRWDMFLVHWRVVVKKRLFGSTMYTHEKDADISFRMIETPNDPYMWAPFRFNNFHCPLTSMYGIFTYIYHKTKCR